MKVNEIFYSLQGEGKDVGLPTIFIRLTGCNLRCSYCDTKYAYYEGNYMDCEEIIDVIKKWKCNRVCITGGEPLLQDIYGLIDMLRGYEVSVETNGSLDIYPLTKKDVVIKMDIKCPSSLMHEKMRMENIELLRDRDELKFIVGDRNDYEYAKKIIEVYSPKCGIVMQPWKNAKKIAEWILRDELDVRFSMQLHKILWKGRRGR